MTKCGLKVDQKFKLKKIKDKRNKPDFKSKKTGNNDIRRKLKLYGSV